jgi:hypothetical protein
MGQLLLTQMTQNTFSHPLMACGLEQTTFMKAATPEAHGQGVCSG